jgi:urea carboxylase
MKMEINVISHAAGRVRELRAGPGRNVKAGDIIAIVEEC